MSLDNFQLPSVLLPELYKDSLVVLDTRQLFPESLKSEKFNFTGGFGKNILLLAADAENETSGQKETDFLLSVLQACKLTMDDVALIQVKHAKEITIADLAAQMDFSTLISFGIPSAKLQLPFHAKNYDLVHEQDRQFLFADSLSDISQNNALKKSLWNALKSVFSIS